MSCKHIRNVVKIIFILFMLAPVMSCHNNTVNDINGYLDSGDKLIKNETTLNDECRVIWKRDQLNRLEFQCFCYALPYKETSIWQEWTIEKLRDIIVANGVFWAEHWNMEGRFDFIYHIGEKTIFYNNASYRRLLPSSGFEKMGEIVDYLLRLNTEERMSNWPQYPWENGDDPTFIIYNDMLYINSCRHSFFRFDWETAIHTLIKQECFCYYVKSVLYAYCFESSSYVTFIFFTTLLNGRIHWDVYTTMGTYLYLTAHRGE